MTDQLEDLFAELRTETITRVRPPGPAVARRTVRRRRTTLVAAGCVVAAVAVGAGVQTIGGTTPRPPAGADPALLAERQSRAVAKTAVEPPTFDNTVLVAQGVVREGTVVTRTLVPGTYLVQMACSGPGRATATATVPGSTVDVTTVCELDGENTQPVHMPLGGDLSVRIRPSDGAAGQAAFAIRVMMLADDLTGLINTAGKKLPAGGATVLTVRSFLPAPLAKETRGLAAGSYLLVVTCSGAGKVEVSVDVGGQPAGSGIAGCIGGGRPAQVPFTIRAGSVLTMTFAPDADAVGQAAVSARARPR